MTDIQKRLFEMADTDYKSFTSALIPTVDKSTIIGIRTPNLRKYAKELAKSDTLEFLNTLPHKYYEENNLHAYLIETISDFDAAILKTECFLPYIDNWSTCDTFIPKAFRKNPERLMPYIQKWLSSERTYTVRYAIKLLMSLFLDELFRDDINADVANVRSDEYYINMMIAWYFATALAKQYDATIPYITGKKLDTLVHNKAIQKAIESRRIPDTTKEYLRTLKIK